jgi:hypothetical protein
MAGQMPGHFFRAAADGKEAARISRQKGPPTPAA